MKINRYKSLLLEIVLLIGVALIFFVTSGWLGLCSVMLGGIAWLLPSQYFFWRLRLIRTIFSTDKLLHFFWRSELVKLLFSFALIILFLLLLPVNSGEFLIGYLMVILSSFLLILRVER